MMSSLEPLGLPLATAVVPGHHADDPLHLPAVRQVRASLGQGGDCCTWGIVKWRRWRRARFSTWGRIFICARCRRSRGPADLLDSYLAPVWTGEQDVTPIYRPRTPGSPEQIAEGYELQEPRRPSWRARRARDRTPAGDPPARPGTSG